MSFHLPQPGLTGDYGESCTVCLRGTDTGLTLSGEPEWVIAALVNLGLPQEQGLALLSSATGCEPGLVPDGGTAISLRLCGRCAQRAPIDVAVGPVHAPLPAYGQRNA
jgi:hypothetical protein